MARLYEYADSNNKSGYFLRGATSDSNYTMRATDLGRRLFDRLDYDPGVVNRERGPRIPSQLQWAMYDVGLLTTSGSEPKGAGIDGELDVEDAEITEEIIAKIESFVHEEGGDQTEVRKLAEMLDIEVDRDENKEFWNLPESEMSGVEGFLREYLKGRLNSEKAPHWSLSVDCTRQTFEEIEKGVIEIRVEHLVEDHEKYLHVGYICPEHGFERIATACASEVDWESRRRLEQHRVIVIEAIIDMADELAYYIGGPTADIDLLTHEEMEVFD